MKKLTRLWQALERIPGLCNVLASWEHHCGADYALIRPHLRPTDDFGARYPCPHPHDADCPRAIVDYGNGVFAAVCRHPHKLCEDVPLSAKDALVHRLDLDAALRPLANALAVRIQNLQIRVPGVWGLGASTARSTRDHPAFLFVFSRGSDFRSAVREVALSCPTPFVAVAPTSTFLTVELREVLGRRDSTFISLEDRVGLSEDGRFVAIATTGGGEIPPTPVERRHAVVEKYKHDFDYSDQAIYEDSMVHKSDFYRWMKGTLDDKSIKSKRIEETLRTDPSLRTRR
jgi:hypothetical protein